MNGIYLDWAATAPPDPEAIAAQARAASEHFANPSSIHAPGKAARKALEEARARVARLLGAKAERIVFCSGGTEANQIAVSSLLCRRGGGRLLTTRAEHPSVHECALGLEARGLGLGFLKMDASGLVDPSSMDLGAAREADMISLCAVNNETGAMQDLPRLVGAIRGGASGKRVHIHADAVQAFGKVAFLPGSLDIDSASFSAHKVGGPRGIGFLWLARPLEALLRGGGQEGGLRSGTENVAGAVAAAMALEKAMDGLEEKGKAAALRMERLMVGIEALGGRLLPETRKASPSSFSPWILQAALPPVPGEALVRFMSDSGCAISTGSACSSSRKGRRVLDALGVDPSLSQCAFRVSQGPSTSDADIGSFLSLLREAAARMKVAGNG